MDDEKHDAEVDFAVHPTMPARASLHSCSATAAKGRARDINTFISYISVGNERVFGVFQKLDYVIESTLIGGVYDEPCPARPTHPDLPAVIRMVDDGCLTMEGLCRNGGVIETDLDSAVRAGMNPADRRKGKGWSSRMYRF